MNDIDMRQYYYVNSGWSGWKRKSELFLSATSVDDNGTFACFAENKAGKAKAEFTLHVVVPMPPKPPQVTTGITLSAIDVLYLGNCAWEVVFEQTKQKLEKRWAEPAL